MTADDRTSSVPGRAGRLSRRRLLTRGATVGAAGLVSGVTGFPFINRMTARAQGKPLKFWQFYAPGGQVVSQSKWFETMIADWNGSHDQQIELEYVPNNDYMDGTRLPTAFASGEGPDLFIISPGDFLRYYNGGVLLDLTPFIEKDAQADFPETVIANRMVDGKIYGVPMEVEPMAMYYSIPAFEEAGLNENDVPQTWDQLFEVAKKLTNDKRYGVLFDVSPGYYQNFTWYPFMWQGDGDIQGADGKSALRLARRDPGAEVLAGRGEQRHRPPAGAGRRRLGRGAEPRVGLRGDPERRDLGDRGAARGGAGPEVRHLQAADAGGRQVRDGGRRLGVRGQRQGRQPGGGGRVLRLGAGLDEPGLDPAGGRLVHGREERHAAAQERAGEGRARRSRTG